MKRIVYILGTTRSGTSALRNALALSRYRGYGEGHLVPLLSEFVQTIRYNKTEGLGAKVPGNAMHALQVNVFTRFIFDAYERYLSQVLKSDYILDKTPTIVPIQFAPVLKQFHNEVKFIYCARRHIDNILSKRRKFPELSFEHNCREWAACAQAWLSVRDELGGDHLEFDFWQLASDPEKISRGIGDLLELDEHEVTRMTEYLVANRPQATPDRNLLEFRRLSEVDWTEVEKETFFRICGPTGENLGYGLEDYFA